MFVTALKAIRLNHYASENAGQVLDNLSIVPGMTIADIGSGGGFFTIKFSELVGPEGRVYAVDMDKRLLSFIAKDMRRRGIRNIELLRSGPNGGALPENSCHLAFIRNVFHHLPSPVAYMRTLRPALKEGGRIAIVEWLPGRSSRFGRKHGTEPSDVMNVMEKAGYRRETAFDFLPKQSFGIYVAANKRTPNTL